MCITVAILAQATMGLMQSCKPFSKFKCRCILLLIAEKSERSQSHIGHFETAQQPVLTQGGLLHAKLPVALQLARKIPRKCPLSGTQSISGPERPGFESEVSQLSPPDRKPAACFSHAPDGPAQDTKNIYHRSHFGSRYTFGRCRISSLLQNSSVDAHC